MRVFPPNLDRKGVIVLEKPLSGGADRLTRNDPTFSDLAGLLTGIKPVTYTDCLPTALPALKELCGKLKIKVLLPETGEERGRHFAGDGRKVMVLIGRRQRDLAKAAEAWKRSTVGMDWGLALGYPECCVKAFAAWFANGGATVPRPDLVRRTAAGTAPGGPLDFRLNNVWNYFSRLDYKDPADRRRHEKLLVSNPGVDIPSLHVISWHPCSYRCRSSARKAAEIYSFIEHYSPAYAAGLKNLLARPLLFRDKYELAALKGTFRQGALDCRGETGPVSLLGAGTRRLLSYCDELRPGAKGIAFRRAGKTLFSSVPGEFILLNFR
ncbi:MAG: hypothetical protein RQ748_07550 [Elusimicrobiales bacterium]|nr:hypothetical protein [Elusimicrobiales bacterium]